MVKAKYQSFRLANFSRAYRLLSRVKARLLGRLAEDKLGGKKK